MCRARSLSPADGLGAIVSSDARWPRWARRGLLAHARPGPARGTRAMSIRRHLHAPEERAAAPSSHLLTHSLARRKPVDGLFRSSCRCRRAKIEPASSLSLFLTPRVRLPAVFRQKSRQTFGSADALVSPCREADGAAVAGSKRSGVARLGPQREGATQASGSRLAGRTVPVVCFAVPQPRLLHLRPNRATARQTTSPSCCPLPLPLHSWPFHPIACSSTAALADPLRARTSALCRRCQRRLPPALSQPSRCDAGPVADSASWSAHGRIRLRQAPSVPPSSRSPCPPKSDSRWTCWCVSAASSWITSSRSPAHVHRNDIHHHQCCRALVAASSSAWIKEAEIPVGDPALVGCLLVSCSKSTHPAPAMESLLQYPVFWDQRWFQQSRCGSRCGHTHLCPGPPWTTFRVLCERQLPRC